MVTENNCKGKFGTISERLGNKCYGFGVRHLQSVCMCLCMISLFIARGSMAVAVLAMTDHSRINSTDITIYEWDKNIQGLILSSFFWGYTLMQIPAGLLAKRYGGKPVLLVALLANGVICGLLPVLSYVGGWPVVCACRVLMGLTQACLFPASHTLLGRWLPAQERTTLTGIIYGGTQLGTIIAMPLSGLLAETAIGWKLIFYSISGLMFTSAVVWYFFSASTPGEHRFMTELERQYIERGLNTCGGKVLRTPWRHILRSRGLWAIAITHIGFSCSYVLFFVDMPTYLEKGLHISLKNSASLSALPYAGMWLGNIVSASVSEKIFNRGLLSVGTCRKLFNSVACFGMAVGLAGLSFIGKEHENMAIAVLVATLTLYGFSSAGFMMSHLDMSPNFAGVMLSLTNFIANFGSVGTPLLTSFILNNDPMDLSRWRICFLIISSLLIVTNIMYMIFASAKCQPWDDPDFEDKKSADPEEVTPALTSSAILKAEEAKNH
ncbi:putative inorganic phosphate cotransporter isoform X1 [Papilio machaon]|uniref:putative inorganic phosphate cotransporter isoform X1 n=1 Tax=Papilio machaon TaxID=76193 RepID=UPI001E6661C2|nr:putative inorganic phosphate cotransporter isoform X1 [Papilio machaon]